MPLPITYHIAQTFVRFEALPQGAKAGFHPGVLVIQKGPAKGHFAVNEGTRVVNYDRDNPEHASLRKYQIVIGDTTLDDVVRCGSESETSKAKLDHGATVRDIFGDYTNFRRDGEGVRADLTLMESTPHRGYVEELISRMSKKVGNSIDFDYIYEIQGECAVARCIKLNSVDLVDAPAATNSLFQETTQPENHMPLSKEDLEAIGNTVDGKIEARFGKLETELNTRFTKLEEGKEEETEEEKKKREAKEKEGSGDKAEMSAMIKTSTMAAVREIFPKATIENLNQLGAKPNSTDEYAEKVQLCVAAGITDAGAQARHIARKFPLVYNAKFGGGEGGKGSAKL